MASGWLWVERVSWLVTIITLPGLAIGLATIVRRPRLIAGFPPLAHGGPFRRKSLPAVLEVPIEFRAGSELSEPVTFHLVVANIGNGTAREVDVLHLLPGDLDESQISIPPLAVGWLGRSPADDKIHWSAFIEHIHADRSRFAAVTLRVPSGLDVLPIETQVSWANGPLYSVRLLVRLLKRAPRRSSGPGQEVAAEATDLAASSSE